MVCKNNRVPNDHLRKDWYRRVKTYFDDPARKVRRQKARAARAKKIAPRPVEGPLRPIIRCPTIRYNRRIRLGRGFTREELIGAGLDPSRARFLGIAVDKFRLHSKDATTQQNIERLKAYTEKIVRVHKGEKLPEGVAQPGLFRATPAEQQVKWRAITSADQKANFFKEKSEARKAWKDAVKAKKEQKHKK
jgi:large subunit ribosomal protein L13e